MLYEVQDHQPWRHETQTGNQWAKDAPGGQVNYRSQTGLGIDCSGLQERWLLENRHNTRAT